jgi:hypothetical protein
MRRASIGAMSPVQHCDALLLDAQDFWSQQLGSLDFKP